MRIFPRALSGDEVNRVYGRPVLSMRFENNYADDSGAGNNGVCLGTCPSISQAGISGRANARWVGRTIDVIVEGPDPQTVGLWTGRGRFQAPEVDGIVRFSLAAGRAEPPAAIVRVVVDSAGAYDLAGRQVR